MTPTECRELRRIVADSAALMAELETFAWDDWRQIEGGRWRSPGGRVLSDATYQRMRSGGQASGGSGSAVPSPTTPPATSGQAATPAASRRSQPAAQPTTPVAAKDAAQLARLEQTIQTTPYAGLVALRQRLGVPITGPRTAANMRAQLLQHVRSRMGQTEPAPGNQDVIALERPATAAVPPSPTTPASSPVEPSRPTIAKEPPRTIAPPTDPPRKPVGVTITSYDGLSTITDETKRTAARLFGPDAISGGDLLAASNAVDGAKVAIYREGNGSVLRVSAGVPGKYYADRSFSRGDDGKVVVHNNISRIVKTRNPQFDLSQPPHPDKNPEWVQADPRLNGTEIFVNQVRGLKKLGVDRIKTTAARSDSNNPDNSMNGYYTWPRMGFDGSVPSAVYSELPPNLKQQVDSNPTGSKIPRSVLNLYTTQEGRDWWQKNGDEVHDAVFDLSDGSLSMRTLNAYLNERNQKAAASKPQPAAPTAIPAPATVATPAPTTSRLGRSAAVAMAKSASLIPAGADPRTAAYVRAEIDNALRADQTWIDVRNRTETMRRGLARTEGSFRARRLAAIQALEQITNAWQQAENPNRPPYYAPPERRRNLLQRAAAGLRNLLTMGRTTAPTTRGYSEGNMPSEGATMADDVTIPTREEVNTYLEMLAKVRATPDGPERERLVKEMKEFRIAHGIHPG